MKRMFLALAAVALLATPANDTDGHFLHGIGAVNSSMGGAGVAQPKSLLGAFYLNPAGLMDGLAEQVVLVAAAGRKDPAEHRVLRELDLLGQ